MNILMAVIGLVGLKRAPECIKMHNFEGENAKIFLGTGHFGASVRVHSTPQTTFLDTGLSEYIGLQTPPQLEFYGWFLQVVCMVACLDKA